MNRASRFAFGPAAVSLALLATLAGSAPLAHADGAPAAWDVTPRGAWVDALPLPNDGPAPAAPSASRGGLRILLDDRQVRLGEATGAGAKSTQTYYREAQHVVGSAGVERVSEVRISFDPSYERLHLHSLRVHRGGVARDVPLTAAVVRVFYEESDADARVYDGRMVALIVVPDVRVGDTLESEYTLEGANPVFGGRYADQWYAGSSFDLGLLRIRLLAPPSRVVTTRVRGAEIAPTSRDLGGLTEVSWTRENVAAVEMEDDLPKGFDPIPRISLSEYASWGDVASWARGLFPDVTIGTTGAMADAVRTIDAGSKTQADKALAALRLVQDDVRYLGMEIGENSHRPHSPESVLAQRFGDCKDKAYLLVTLLRGLGIDAHVALVHSRRGASLPGALPSPGAFNHAIVHATLDGKKVFLDATVANQGGSFVAHGTPPFENALCVEDGSKDLTPIVAHAPKRPTQTTHESYHRAREGGTALDVETTFREGEADDLRRYLAEVPPAEISKRYLNAYAAVHPGIEARGGLEVHDDRAANVIVVGEHYAIPEGRPFDWSYDASSLRGALRAPRTVLRKLPLAVDYPFFRRHEIEMTVDGRPRGIPEDLTRKSGALSFQRAAHVEGDTVSVSYELQSLAPSVEAKDVDAHLRLLKELRSSLDGEIDVEGNGASAASKGGELSGAWGFGITVFVVLGLIGVTNSKTIARRFSWHRKLDRKRGETPGDPMPAATRDVAAGLLLAMPCLCGARGGKSDAIAWSHLRYEERIVTSGRIACSCGERRVGYFAVDADLS